MKSERVRVDKRTTISKMFQKFNSAIIELGFLCHLDIFQHFPHFFATAIAFCFLR